MWVRICYPKIWYVGTLNILRWSNLRNGWSRRTLRSPTSLPKQVIKLSCERCLPFARRKGASLSCRRGVMTRIWMNRPCQVSLSLPLAHTLSSYYIFPWLSALQQTSYKHVQVSPFLEVFISIWRFQCYKKFILNKCVSFVNLSFVNQFTWPQRENPGG